MPERILVVDDDRDTTGAMERILAKAGFTVAVENVSRNALGAAIEFRPDVVLLDFDMPGLSGGQVAWQIYRDLRLVRTRMIVCTGRSPSEVVSSLPPVRIPIVEKPIVAEALLRFLRSSVPAEELVEAAAAPVEMGMVGARPDEWLWCSRCARCFHKRDLTRGGAMLANCAYEDCDGKVAYHGWPWAAVRLRHPEYPEAPERGVCYAGPIPKQMPVSGPCAPPPQG